MKSGNDGLFYEGPVIGEQEFRPAVFRTKGEWYALIVMGKPLSNMEDAMDRAILGTLGMAEVLKVRKIMKEMGYE
jgi:hypothetical protein